MRKPKQTDFLFDQLAVLSDLWRHRSDMRTARKIRSKTGMQRRINDAVERERLTSEIRRRRSRGQSYGAIASDLNRCGLFGMNGARWYAASVSAYLRKTAESLPTSEFDPHHKSDISIWGKSDI